jgi:hypothetical protein
MRDEMTLKDFCDLIDRYGGTPERWPPAAAEAAARVLVRLPEARRALGALRRAEALIAETGAGTRSDDLAVRAMAAPQLKRATLGPGAAAGFSIAAALILSLGVLVGATRPAFDDPQAALAVALGLSPENLDAD